MDDIYPRFFMFERKEEIKYSEDLSFWWILEGLEMSQSDIFLLYDFACDFVLYVVMNEMRWNMRRKNC